MTPDIAAAVPAAGLSAVDIVALVLIGICALRAAFVGFIKEITALGAVIVGTLCSLLFSSLLAPVIEGWLGPTYWNQVISFIVIFAIVFVFMLFIRKALTTIVEGLNIHAVNHFLGFLLGVVEGILVVFILLFLSQLQQIVDTGPALNDSITWKLLSPFLGYVDGIIK